MMKRALRAYAELITEHARVFLIAMLVLGALCAVAASQLQFKSSYVDLLPDDAPELAHRDDVMSQVKGTTELILTVEGPPEKRLAFAREAVKRLNAEPEFVLSARVEFPIDFFQDRWLYLLPIARIDELRGLIHEAREQLVAGALAADFDDPDEPKPDPWADLDALGRELKAELGITGDDAGITDLDAPLDRTITSEDGKYLFALIQPAGTIGEFDQTRRVYENIERIIDDAGPQAHGVKANIAGRMPMTIEEHDLLTNDMFTATIAALILVILMMIVVTRRLTVLVVIGYPLVLGIVMTLAVTALTIGHLNMISGFMVPALVGLGVDFCIHLYLYFQDQLTTGVEKKEAMRDAIEHMFVPCFASAATTSVAFLALLVNDFEGISEYGLVASYGVLITLFVTFFALPPLAVLLTPQKQRARRQTRLPQITRGVAVITVVASLAVALFAGWSAKERLGFRNDFEKLRGTSQSNDFYNEIAEKIGGPIDPSLIMVNSTEDARRVKKIILDLKASQPEDVATNFGRVASFADIVPPSDEGRVEAMKMLRKELRYLKRKRKKLDDEQRAQLDAFDRLAKAQPWSERAQPWTEKDLPEFFRDRFNARDEQHQFVLFWKFREINHDHELVTWSNQVEALEGRIKDANLDAKLLDEASVTARVIKLLRRDFPLMLALAVGGVLSIIIFTFRRPKKILLIITSLAAGVITMLGVMVWLDVDFNLFNVVVLPSIVGIGIDNAVHMMHGYDELGPGQIRALLATRGRAAALSSATTGVGFGTMIIAHHYGVYTLGAVAIIGVVSTFVFTTLILPAALLLLERPQNTRDDGDQALTLTT